MAVYLVSSRAHAKFVDRFVLNGLRQANEILGEQVFNLDDWRVIGEYVYDGHGGRHQAFYSPIKDVHYTDVHFMAGERVQVEQSIKYSPEETNQLWRASGLNEVGRWSASSEAYSTSRDSLPQFIYLPRHYVKSSHTLSPYMRPWAPIYKSCRVDRLTTLLTICMILWGALCSRGLHQTREEQG
jgi:hypothetical protein